ncbi:MAG: hypothetical protein K2X69_03655 [Silvanigrellaceae bacterium]|nr:hypothetical protein [Silvanigrellaceae bacterium]
MINQIEAMDLTELEYAKMISYFDTNLSFSFNKEIKECIKLGGQAATYWVYFKKRDEYCGMLLQLLDMHRENKLRFFIKHLTKLGYQVSFEDIIKESLVFSNRVVGFKLSISWVFD